MAPFRDRPIRYKVALLIAVASVVGMAFAGVVVIVYDLVTFRPRVVRDLESQAEIIGLNTIPALTFGDPKAASENLATLRSRPEIGFASIRLPSGPLFASYARDSTVATPPAERRAPGFEFRSGHLLLTRALTSDDLVLGYLTLEYDLPSVWTRLARYGIMAATVLLALLTAAVLLSRTLARTVSSPLGRLAEVSRQIAATRDFRVRVPKDANDEIGQLTEAFNDMLGTLQRSEERLRLALDAAAMRITEAGSVDALLEEVHPADRDLVRRIIGHSLEVGEGFEVEFRTPGSDGTERWSALRGHGGGGKASQLVGVLQDVTDRRHLEMQLIQSQKMEAIGNLAGGIAHDFNNLLTAIIGYVKFVERALPPDSVIRADVEEIDRAARRAALLTSQLLSYARRQMVMPRLWM